MHRSNKCAALVSLRNMNVLVLRYTLDNQELANLSLSRTSQTLGSKLLGRISFLQKITFLAC